MDRRTLLALTTLAAAAAATPALAAQVARAAATGDPNYISREDLIRSIYNVSMSPVGEPVGIDALLQLGYDAKQAAQISDMARSLAKRAGSYEAFAAIVEGRAPMGVRLSTEERHLIRHVAVRPGSRLPHLAVHLSDRDVRLLQSGPNGNLFSARSWSCHDHTWEGTTY